MGDEFWASIEARADEINAQSTKSTQAGAFKEYFKENVTQKLVVTIIAVIILLIFIKKVFFRRVA